VEQEKRICIQILYTTSICSHYKVLYAEPESGPTSNPEHAERVSIVARDLTLVNVAEIVVMCFEGREIYSWGAAIELGYAYGCGKRIVIFNLSDEDTYFFMKYLPQDANHEVYIIEDKQLEPEEVHPGVHTRRILARECGQSQEGAGESTLASLGGGTLLLRNVGCPVNGCPTSLLIRRFPLVVCP